jgi:hypothetical protein
MQQYGVLRYSYTNYYYGDAELWVVRVRQGSSGMLGKAKCAGFAIVLVSATGLCCAEEDPWDNSSFSANMATASFHWDSARQDTEHSAHKYES